MTTANSKYYNGFCLPDYAEDYLSQYQDLEVRDDDIYIACFPKVGTTWLQNVVYYLVYGFDYDDPNGKTLDDCVPYIEFFPGGLENVKMRQGLRILKTHMPYSLLPPPLLRGKAKILTIARNPRDTAVSYYHFARMGNGYAFDGDWPEFMKIFMEDQGVLLQAGKTNVLTTYSIMTTANSKYYNGFCLPDYAEDYLSQYQDLEVRDDDIYIACFPKVGTTWLQNVVYYLVYGFDYDDPNGKTLDDCVPYIEFFPGGLENVKMRQGLRILKTHMPYSLLPPPLLRGKAKILTIARNPRDTAVSYYHFARMGNGYAFDGDWPEFMKIFMEDQVDYGPYDKYLEEYWLHRNDGNMLFLFYEDMKRNLPECVKTIAKFLNRDVSPEVVDQITEKCSFKSMEKDPVVNKTWMEDAGYFDKNISKFMRKGDVGDWKNHLTPEDVTCMDDKFKYLEGHGLTFTYEL